MIVDYAWTKPTIAQLKAAKVNSVGRYIGQDKTGKNLTVAEVKELNHNDIQIVTVFEYAAAQATGGWHQGDIDGNLARDQIHALGQPAGSPVYWSIDFDIPDYAPHSSDPLAKLGPVGEYYKALQKHFSLSRIGAYGDFYALERLWKANLIKWTWQTLAWSGGQVLDKVTDIPLDLLQEGTKFNGIADVDIHRATGRNYGQWTSLLVKPPAPVATADIMFKGKRLTLKENHPVTLDPDTTITLLEVHPV